MRILALSRFTLNVSAAAFLVACGESQPPIGVHGTMPQSPALATRAGRDGSWMLAEAKNEDLLYVSNTRPSNNVTVYSYVSHRLVGTLGNLSYPAGICVDKSGDVYIANEDGDDIIEYAHGGTTPIKTLADSDGAIDCSIDATTGNLAVANAGYIEGPPGSLYVFKNAEGSPTKYTDGDYIIHFNSCVYDSKGNLFVDGSGQAGVGSNGGVGFAELPKSGGSLTNIRLTPKPGPLALPGGLAWDDKYVTMYSDSARNVIFRLTIKGDRAHHRHYTSLAGGYADNYYWIQRDSGRRQQVLVGANNLNRNEVLYWHYPAGGDPFVTIKDGITDPVAVAVSIAPSYQGTAVLRKQ